MHIAIIGGGVMGSLFARAWVKANLVSAESLIVIDPNIEKSRLLKAELNCKCLTEASSALSATELVLLAVKPQEAEQACIELDRFLPKNAAVISIMAGIQISSIEQWLPGRAVVRCMPNTPAKIGMGLTAYYKASKTRFDPAPYFNAVGQSVQVADENLIDAATAVSGSGPAYFYYFFEHMLQVAQKLGFSGEQAKTLITATASGATALWKEGSAAPEELRAAVTSKGGTTAAGIKVFEDKQVGQAIQEGLVAACQRAKELSRKL